MPVERQAAHPQGAARNQSPPLVFLSERSTAVYRFTKEPLPRTFLSPEWASTRHDWRPSFEQPVPFNCANAVTARHNMPGNKTPARMHMSHSKFRRASASPHREGQLWVGCRIPTC